MCIYIHIYAYEYTCMVHSSHIPILVRCHTAMKNRGLYKQTNKQASKQANKRTNMHTIHTRKNQPSKGNMHINPAIGNPEFLDVGSQSPAHRKASDVLLASTPSARQQARSNPSRNRVFVHQKWLDMNSHARE